MSVDDAKLLAVGVLWLLSLVVVGYAGYMMRDSLSQPEDTSYAPEVIQGDGSVVLERVPDPSPSPPPHQLPRGAVEQRRVTAQLQPPRTAGAPASKPIGLTLSLVEVDGGRRAVMSADGAQIIGGADVPIVALDILRQFSWAAGVSYDPFHETVGVWVDRDIERIRIGADLYQDRDGADIKLAARLRVGWVF